MQTMLVSLTIFLMQTMFLAPYIVTTRQLANFCDFGLPVVLRTGVTNVHNICEQEGQDGAQPSMSIKHEGQEGAHHPKHVRRHKIPRHGSRQSLHVSQSRRARVSK